MSAPDDIVEFWASAMDAFLQQFSEAHKAGDANRLSAECARLAQLGQSMSELFSRLVVELESSGVSREVASRATRSTKALVEKHVSRIQAVSAESAQAKSPVTKSSAN